MCFHAAFSYDRLMSATVNLVKLVNINLMTFVKSFEQDRRFPETFVNLNITLFKSKYNYNKSNRLITVEFSMINYFTHTHYYLLSEEKSCCYSLHFHH